MSHELRVWEQPADEPLPSDAAAVWARLADWSVRDDGRVRPKFVELASQVNGRLAAAGIGGEDDDDPPFADGPLDGQVSTFVWTVRLGAGESQEAGHAVLATYAMALGLNVADAQGNRLYLADGRILSPDPSASCTPAFALYFCGDDAGAWQAFLDLGAQGNPTALYQLAAMAQQGQMGRRNEPLALALLMLGGHRDDAQRLAASAGPAVMEAAGPLLDRLRAQPAQFKAIVDANARPLLAPRAAAPLPPAAPPAPVESPAPRPARALTPEPEPEVPVPSGGVDATLSLVAGIAGLPLAAVAGLLVGAWAFWLGLVATLAAGAWGAWHAGRARGWDATQVMFYAVVAAIPVVGALACARLLMRR